MRQFRAACSLSLPALLLGVLSVPPAQAAVTTSTGVTCTVVGTAGRDVLTGTGGRDVICGRGGNDVVRAGGGNDLVDAGAGGDDVFAGPGADKVLAAGGADEVVGGDGADRLLGGAGPDDLSGDGGGDTLNGGDGTDTLGGDAGGDTVNGGDGADTIEGGAAADDLDGQGGDDDLTGDAGADDLDGGAGTNLCIVDAADDSVRCKYDELPPVMVETVIDPVSVDVTHASAEVTVMVHATDDTGVEDVQLSLLDESVVVSGPPAELVSGTARDGWWRTTFEVGRWTPPGVLRPDVAVRDRLDRQTFDDSSPARLEVIDENPDTERPRLTLVSPVDPEPVDVRTSGADVKVTVRATDNLSGVHTLRLCLGRAGDGLYQEVVCDYEPARVSGTLRDGAWTATLRVPKAAPSGDWNVMAYASDRAQPEVFVDYVGPDAYKAYVDGRWCCSDIHPFQDGAGRLLVIGAEDRTPAWTDSVTLTPTEVDTLEKDATTRVRVHALDADCEGVTGVMAVLIQATEEPGGPQFTQTDLTLVEGSSTDGVWEADLLLPQGTPGGRYDVLVSVSDIEHAQTYVSASSWYADSDWYRKLENDPHVDVVAR